MLGGGDDVTLRVQRFGIVGVSVGTPLVALEAAFVATQPFLNPLGRDVSAGVRIGSERFRFENDAGVEMNHAFGAETKCFLGNHHMARKSTVEIFSGRVRD